MNHETDDIWLVVGHLLRDLSLSRWRQALVWARSLVKHLADRENENAKE